MSWRELNHAVARLHHAFAKAGLKPGDRVAAIVPNMPETIVAFLAVTSLGGVWSSCSPDFGERGILDRFGQIKPRFLVACDGYYYNGKTIPIANKVAAVLKSCRASRRRSSSTISARRATSRRTMPRAVAYEDYISRKQLEPIKFAQLPFDHPLYILYSSGTTGIPKCIVHRRRRRASQASLRTPAQFRCEIQRPPVLFHHLRLDDVELAGERACDRCHAAAL